MKKHIAAYDKHVDFTDLAGGYDDAVQRARQLDQQAEADDERGRNPTTGFYRLTSSILDDGSPSSAACEG